MRLTRHGSRRFHKQTEFFNKTPSAQWFKQSGRLVLSIDKVPADDRNMFDYDVALSLEDLRIILDELATGGIDQSPNEFSAGLARSAASLGRLWGVANGFAMAGSTSATDTPFNPFEGLDFSIDSASSVDSTSNGAK
jgi:hypothetical protein